MTKSPLAPKTSVSLPPIAGVRLCTAQSAVKYQGRDDLLLVELASGTQVAGVLTQSSTASAPVHWCRRCLANHQARGLVVNAGNANAFTGAVGEQHVLQTASEAAVRLGCEKEDIFIASTGVIGEFLPIEKIIGHLDTIVEGLSSNQWIEAGKAILTTDTFSKLSTVETHIGATKVVINGIAKGSGMIEPDMATMLAFVFTDANIDGPILQQLLAEANEESFNAITVDSDTSTSDTCLVFATGQAGNPVPIKADDPSLEAFRDALGSLMQDLAVQVIRDGEGASKLIEVHVSGGEDDLSAKRIAKSIANSPLVKTAIAGEDANWGRVVMAIGKAGEPVNQAKINVGFGDITIARNGQRVENYDESIVTAHLQGQHVRVLVDVGVGTGRAKVWTCDLTHDYISINADYRS